MQIFSSYLSKKGRNNSVNQDSLCISQFVYKKKRILLAMVCDGIGSFSGSEDASCFLTEWMVNWIYRDGLRTIRSFGSVSLIHAVKREFYRAHRKFCEVSPCSNGTTVSMLLAIDNKYYIFWCGDCRIYSTRRGRVSLLTEDDSESGVLNACFTNIGYHIPRSKHGRIRHRQGFLLCSDGFYRKLDEDYIKVLLNTGREKDPTDFKTKQLSDCAEMVVSRHESDDMSAVLINTR